MYATKSSPCLRNDSASARRAFCSFAWYRLFISTRTEQVARPLWICFCPSTSRMCSQGPTPNVLRMMSTTVKRSGVVQDVLARADAQRIAHDVDHGEAVGRRLRQPVDRVDHQRT